VFKLTGVHFRKEKPMGGNCGDGGGCCGGCALRARLEAFAEALSLIWCRETAQPSCQAEWDPFRQSLGQCAVTALLVQDLFGGELLRTVPTGHGSHYYNRLPNGWEVDFTRGQFPQGQVFGPAEVRTREYVLESPGAVTAKTKERYELLKSAYERL